MRDILCEVLQLKKFTKKIIMCAFALALAINMAAAPILTSQALAAGDIAIFVNGSQLVSDVAPILENNRTLLPFRACAEALGADVTWVKENQSVIMTKGDTTVTLYIGTNKASVNGEMKVLDVKSQLKNNRTLVPLRFAGEALNCKIDWVPARNAVEITTEENANGAEYVNPLTEEEINTYRSQLLAAVNNIRVSKNIGSAALSDEYSAMAQAHSLDMAAWGYLGTTSSRNGSTADRAAAMQLYTPGENVARISLSSDGNITAAVNTWRSSYLTNAVLLQPSAAYVGIGIAADMNNPDNLYVTLEVPAATGYFTSKPAAVDEQGTVILAGYCSRAVASITVYKMTGSHTYESAETYNAECADGKFSLELTDLQSGSYLAKLSNDTVAFSK